jgi:hypothetical protein
MDGSATPTIETSIASRKIAPQSTSSVPQARRVSRSDPSAEIEGVEDIDSSSGKASAWDFEKWGLTDKIGNVPNLCQDRERSLS